MTMERILVTLIYLFPVAVVAQVKPSVTFDIKTGNYIVQYVGHEGDDERPVLVRLIFEPSTKVIPEISGSMSMFDQRKEYIYRYTIINSHGSRQRILYFALELKTRDVDSILAPNEQWRSSLWSAPARIHWGHTMVSPDGMGTPYNGIAIDSMASGFAVISSGLPSVVETYCEGLAATLSFPDEPPGEIEMLLDSLDTFPNNCVTGITVGPADPPLPFVGSAFLDTLLSYTHQSVDLGWLASKESKHGVKRDDDCDNDEGPDNGIAGNIEQRLKLAQRALEKEDSVKARKELQTLLQKVERVWKRSQDEDKRRGRDRKEEMRSKDDKVIMTSEAYALLKYNLEYVIDRLPERARKGREEKK